MSSMWSSTSIRHWRNRSWRIYRRFDPLGTTLTHTRQCLTQRRGTSQERRSSRRLSLMKMRQRPLTDRSQLGQAPTMRMGRSQETLAIKWWKRSLTALTNSAWLLKPLEATSTKQDLLERALGRKKRTKKKRRSPPASTPTTPMDPEHSELWASLTHRETPSTLVDRRQAITDRSSERAGQLI